MKNFNSILAGWLIDGSGDPIKKNVHLSVSDGRITGIQAFTEKNIVSGQETLDLSGHTVLPCLVDSHVHLFMSGCGDPKIRRHQLDADFETIAPVISEHINQHLSHGILAVRDGGDNKGHALRYKEQISVKNSHIILKVSGKAWRNRRRYGKLIGRPPEGNDSLSTAIAMENNRIDQVKIVNSGLNSLQEFGKETPPQFTLEELQAAVAQARVKNLKVMVHANGKAPVEIAVLSGCHSVEHGFFMGKENLKRMADRNIIWVPTAYTMKAYSEHLESSSLEAEISKRNLDHQMEQIGMAKKLGVCIALGTDAGSLGVHHGQAVIKELKLLIEAGFSLEGAIKCASSNGTALLGIHEFGMLRKGMPATFVAVRGAPGDLPESLSACELYVNGKRLV